jgi:hypothetical protein
MDFIKRLRAAMSGDTAAPPTVDGPPSDLVAAFEQESLSQKLRFDWDQLPTAKAILARPRTDWPEIAVLVVQRFKEIDDERATADHALNLQLWERRRGLCYLLTQLLGATLPFSQEQLTTVLDLCAENVATFRGDVPFDALIRQIKPLAADAPGQRSLAQAVARFAAAMRSPYGPGKTLANAAEQLLVRHGATGPVLVPSPWAKHVAATAPTEDARAAVAHALTAVGKSKPSGTFLKTARKLMAQDPDLAAQVVGLIEAYVPDPHAADPNEDTIRGLLWMLAAANQDALAPALGRYCELCFKKIPNLGARSIKLGNGAIQALAALGTPHAIAELTRLKSRVRYPLVVRRIAATLADLASRLNVGEEELEEMALPTFDLSQNGERRLPMGDGAAIIRITGTKEVTLSFLGGNGRETGSPPKALKDAAPEALATARRLRKDIEAALSGQSARIERLYLSNRSIPFSQWRTRYLEHPLLTGLTPRLIWCFMSAVTAVAALPRADGRFEDVEGQPVTPDADVSVTLWHPLLADADHVLAWRRRLAALGITQPFKQAHREIYLLTDAERATDTYSNRFAAHIIRQHQFKALCDQRGWTYHLMGAWDSHNTPTRSLPERNLFVEFWVNGIENTETTASAVYTVIATDQVRFVAADGEVMPLATVPSLLFSELMRDVDLFVGVCSVGNDPTWQDGGPRGAFLTYWSSYAFGDLSRSAETRAEVLSTLLPCLVIADRCTLSDRFLIVRGQLRTYKIHLGSANIQMEPNDQYLCIVPGRGRSTGRDTTQGLVLPFEGDSMLSIILSKAFMLANDDGITDPSIVRQIKSVRVD